MRILYINHEFTEGAARGEIAATSPATEEVIDSVPAGTAEDVESAVASSKQTFDAWRKMGATESAALLHGIASKVRRHQAELAHLLTHEEAKPISENEEELEWVASTFDYYAELGRHGQGIQNPPVSRANGSPRFAPVLPCGLNICLPFRTESQRNWN